ncbi:hypothetical protein Dimus_013414, partial [Dionaea muscipula]
ATRTPSARPPPARLAIFPDSTCPATTCLASTNPAFTCPTSHLPDAFTSPTRRRHLTCPTITLPGHYLLGQPPLAGPDLAWPSETSLLLVDLTT